MNNKPIGIFDSGIGGLSVWKEIKELLPNESLIYLADSANCPYGPRSKEEIIKLSVKNTEFLLDKGAKLIVVACNTATAAAIDHLRANYEIPFVGMEPAVKPAAMNSETGNIGVLATAGTFDGRLYKETSKKFASGVNVFTQVGHGLVKLVESGKFETEEAFQLVKKYIDPMLEQNADHIVLGCTHYPFLSPIIEKIIKGKAAIVDPAPAVAKQTWSLLHEFGIYSKADLVKMSFYSGGDSEIITRFLEKFGLEEFEVIPY